MSRALAALLLTACWTDRPPRKAEPQPLEQPTPVERDEQRVDPRAQATQSQKLRFAPASTYGKLDELGTHTYAADGTPDYVFTLDVDTRLPIKNLFVVVRGRGQQWDTVIGSEPCPAFSELPGVAGQGTWNLGVREGGRWLSKRDGSLPMLQSGRYSLELVADVSGPYSAFEAIVELDDGTWLTASTQGSVVCNALPSGNGAC